jgi:IS30 family transposase
MEYKQLAKEERYYIEQRKANNPFISGRDLAKEMNRKRSTNHIFQLLS